MALSLRTRKEELKIYNEISAEEKDKLESFGNVCIKTGKKLIFINPYDSYDRLRIENFLGARGYSWFKEDTGLGNWVIYNPRHYHVDKNWEQRKILRLNTSEYSGQPLETPINASSLAGMFSWLRIPENIHFGNRFLLDDIIDMSLMFAGTTIPEKVDFSPCLKSDRVTETRYMFFRSIIPGGFNLADMLCTRNVKNMEYMFGQAVIRGTCNLDLDTGNVTDMNHMFFKAKINDYLKIGEKFTIRKDCDISSMFTGCKIGKEEKSVRRFSDLCRTGEAQADTK